MEYAHVRFCGRVPRGCVFRKLVAGVGVGYFFVLKEK